MDFKLVSKNNIGTAVLLLLVIALSQAKTFNFLIDTALGRLFLIVFILCLSYCHKILGVVGVLFIIIMFNSNIYYEGFGNESDTTADTTTADTTTDASADTTTMKVDTDKIKHVVTKKIVDDSNNDITTNSSNNTTTSNNNKIKNAKIVKAAEGFDILGIENNIKRGKQSNSIPVNSFMRDADSVAPYEETSFLGSFSLF